MLFELLISFYPPFIKKALVQTQDVLALGDMFALKTKYFECEYSLVGLSEKMLEINFARNFRHSYHHIWQAATLRAEARGGWDIAIDNLFQGQSIILQFKRPYSIKHLNNSDTKFVFEINNNSRRDQNQILSDIAQMMGQNNVFYALPCVEFVSQLTDLNLTNPREAILQKTLFADIHQQNLTNLGPGKHKVELIWNNGSSPSTGLVYSERPKEIALMTVREYKGFAFEQLKEKLKASKFSEKGIIKSKRLRVSFLTAV